MKGSWSFREAAPERLSERPGLTAPAFQFLLAAGGDTHAPSGEGGFDFLRTIVIKLRWKRRSLIRRAASALPSSFTKVPLITFLTIPPAFARHTRNASSARFGRALSALTRPRLLQRIRRAQSQREGVSLESNRRIIQVVVYSTKSESKPVINRERQVCVDHRRERVGIVPGGNVIA